MELKRCSGCKKELSKASFNRNRSKSDGLQTVCRDCAVNRYGTKLICEDCGIEFKLKHRNIKKRKTRKCKDCLAKHIVLNNKKRGNQHILSTKGYKYVRNMREKHGYVFSHRIAMEKHLDRRLKKTEVVHHIDGDKLNNDINNLFLTTSKGHAKAHNSLEVVALLLLKKGLVRFNREKGIYEINDAATQSGTQAS